MRNLNGKGGFLNERKRLKTTSESYKNTRRKENRRQTSFEKGRREVVYFLELK